MNSTKKTAIIIGALFLIAMVASLAGAFLIEPNLESPDFLGDLSDNSTQVTIGALLELINGIAVILIGVMMFPIFKKQNESLALGYVAFRIVEAVIIFAALLIPLTLITLSQEVVASGATADSDLLTFGSSMITVRGRLYGQMLGVFFGLGALIFYSLLYQMNLVPRWLSIWGLIATVLVFTWNLLELAGISISAGIIFGLPIILNELFLGGWLIVKGFNSPVAASDAK